MTSSRSLLVAVLAASIGFVACSGSDTATESTSATQVESTDAAAGIRVVSPEQAAATIADPPPDLVLLDLNMEEFDKVMDDPIKINNMLQADYAEAKKCNVTGTPTVMINGLKLTGNRSIGNYKARIDQILAPKDNDEAGKEEGS